jgi:type VI secretion system protein ImpB
MSAKMKTPNRSQARVKISYQNPSDGERLVELPFVMGVMADLSGNASTAQKKPVSQREFAAVDIDNFDKYLAKVEPAINFRVANKLDADNSDSGPDRETASQMGVNLTFKSMADFEPAAIARQIPALAVLLQAREELSNLAAYMSGKSDAEERLRALLENPALMQALTGVAPVASGEPATDDQ